MPEIEEKSAPEGAPESETDSESTDTIGEEPRYIITEKMDTIADAARAASMRSIHAIDAAREADLNAREVATITQQSVEEANHSIEETNTFIAATNHAAELALNAAIAARDASHQATEFRRQGRVDIKEMESAIEASGSNLQNQKSRELFERTQALKQQTILLRKQLNNL